VLLLTVVGPIASGKSTVSAALGRAWRAAGHPVAVVDLDDVVDTFGGFVGLQPDDFVRAQHVFGDLVGAWLRRDVDVIAHGPFFDPDEDAAVRHALPAGVVHRRVELTCTFDVALERVTNDPDRLLSAFPDFLRRTYERVEALRPGMPRADWTFDTTTTTVDAIVERVAAEL
jgi:hypothetical protein